MGTDLRDLRDQFCNSSLTEEKLEVSRDLVSRSSLTYDILNLWLSVYQKGCINCVEIRFLEKKQKTKKTSGTEIEKLPYPLLNRKQ